MRIVEAVVLIYRRLILFFTLKILKKYIKNIKSIEKC